MDGSHWLVCLRVVSELVVVVLVDVVVVVRV